MSNYDEEVATVDKQSVELKEPPMYRCILLNDDYTPMDFVVNVLTQIFSKSEDEANKIMLNVHKLGKGICGVYTFAIAETKTRQVEMLADKYGFPLACEFEEES